LPGNSPYERFSAGKIHPRPNLHREIAFNQYSISTVYRKTWSYCLLLLYFLAATGLEVRAHYCGNELRSISIAGDVEKGCCGDREKAAGCCHDKVVKVDCPDDQHKVKTAPHAPAVEFSLAIVPPALDFSEPRQYQLAFSPRLKPLRRGPLRSPSRPIFLLNQVFRI
jgi:hypothetical protein